MPLPRRRPLKRRRKPTFDETRLAPYANPPGWSPKRKPRAPSLTAPLDLVDAGHGEWVAVLAFAEGWQADRDPAWPPPRARRTGGGVEIQAAAARADGREPLEGERVCLVPAEVRGNDWNRTVWMVEVLAEGRLRVEQHEVDDDGWYLVPRVLTERPATLADHEKLHEVSP